ncbi:MAG: VOC family protein [Acidimicrobiales bacterium]|jgi:glyoxylase I family protein|nr:VOC family protein [Acidimicrobiales bacterium]
MTPGSITVTGFSHVAIAVTDLGAARDFYCGVLGFEELPRPDLGIPGMWLRVGDLQLHFVETDEMPTPGRGFPHYALHVPTDRFDETVEALRAAGAPFLGEPSTRVDFGTTVLAAFVNDPAGNFIELTNVGPA